MGDQLINFETAKLAKEKKFDVPCRLCYADDDILRASPFNSGNRDHINSKHEYYSATTQSLLQKWLRDEHKIYVTALPFRDIAVGIELYWYYSLVQDSEELDDILCNEFDLGSSDSNYQTYEEALEAGLQAALHHLATDI